MPKLKRPVNKVLQFFRQFLGYLFCAETKGFHFLDLNIEQMLAMPGSVEGSLLPMQ